MSKKILIVGEGPHELGCNHATELAPESLPALPMLVHRILGEPSDTSYFCKKIKDVKHVGYYDRKGNKWYYKAVDAIVHAMENKYDGLVILIDRDNSLASERKIPLENARDDKAAHCAIGNAVQMFDAWMIADENAVKTAGGNHKHTHQNPESLSNPKDNAFTCFEDKNLVGFYAEIAKCVDLKLLSSRCSKGFEPFKKEVEQYLKPLFS